MPNFRFQRLFRTLFSLYIQEILIYFGTVTRRYQDNFYVILAIIFGLIIGLNATFNLYSKEVDTTTLDQALKYRFSSPVPSNSIVILDIDEKSLEVMSKDYGRWPWPREVLAEAIATLSESEVLAVVFNIMLSDPDIRNIASDKTFNEIAKESTQIIYPMIRLNPENDKLSQIQLGMLKGAVGSKQDLEKTIALIIPTFSGTHDKLGIANLNTDEDGVIRRYKLHSIESGVLIPSIVIKIVELLQKKVKANVNISNEQTIILNWRNKQGDYERISFSDFFLSGTNSKENFLKKFYGKIIVLGVSAPGISSVKTTPVARTVDDNLIIATAIDDVISNTHLKILSPLLQSVFAILFICALCWGFYRTIDDNILEAFFFITQTAFIAITVVSISFSNQLFDLTLAFLFGSAYFIIAKIYSIVERSAYRGNELFSKYFISENTVCHVLCIQYENSLDKNIKLLQRELEKTVGIKNVFYLDNIFGKDNFISKLGEKFDFLLIFDKNNTLPTSENSILTNLVYINSPKTEVLQRKFFSKSFACHKSFDIKTITKHVAILILELSRHSLFLKKDNPLTV